VEELEGEANVEAEIEFDTLVEEEPEYDISGDCELDTLGVSEFDEIHETVFIEDTEGGFVIELLKVSETVDVSE
jgi:hypothetical protein